jgi:hypothetical protein
MLDFGTDGCLSTLLFPIVLVLLIFFNVDQQGNFTLNHAGWGFLISMGVMFVSFIWYVVKNQGKWKAEAEAKRKEKEELERPLLEKLYGEDAKKFGITPKECETLHLKYIRYWYDCVKRGKKNIPNFEEYAANYLKESIC